MTNWHRWMALPLPTRWAICVWVALLLGVFGRVAFGRTGAQSVVPIYAMAGERWWNGEPLYDPPPDPLDVYRNPPGFAAVFAPLAQLPPRFVGLLWRFMGIALFMHGLRRFLAAVGPPLPPRAEATVWIVAAFLVLPAFNNGQVNLPLVAAALQGAAAAMRAEWWRASAWLMLAVWLKGYPIALAALIALLAPARLGWRMPLVLTALLAWPFACQDPRYVLDQHDAFWSATQADERGEAPLERTMKGWTYLVRAGRGEFVPPTVLRAAAAVSGLSLAAVVLLAARRTGATPGLYARVLCLGLLWMVLFGPATESNTYSILAPAGWLLVGPRLPSAAKAIAGLGIGLLLAILLSGAFPSHSDHTLAALQPLGALLLFGVAVWESLGASPAAA